MAVCARFRVLSGGGFGLGFGGGGCKAVSDETDETLKPQADCPELPNATLQPAPPPPLRLDLVASGWELGLGFRVCCEAALRQPGSASSARFGDVFRIWQVVWGSEAARWCR